MGHLGLGWVWEEAWGGLWGESLSLWGGPLGPTGDSRPTPERSGPPTCVTLSISLIPHLIPQKVGVNV